METLLYGVKSHALSSGRYTIVTTAEDKLLAEVEKKLGYEKYRLGDKVITTRPLYLNKKKRIFAHTYPKGIEGEVIATHVAGRYNMVCVNFFKGTYKACSKWLSIRSIKKI